MISLPLLVSGHDTGQVLAVRIDDWMHDWLKWERSLAPAPRGV